MKKVILFMLVSTIMTEALSFKTIVKAKEYDNFLTPSEKVPRINKTKLVLKAGQIYKLKVKNSNGKKIKWKSGNIRIVKVSKKGVVKARKKGNTKITATVGKTKLNCQLWVNKMSAEEVYKKLKKHYKNGAEDCSDLAVVTGIVKGSVYSTMIRCGVPGNPTASQPLYAVDVNMNTGDATQIRVLTDNKVTKFNIND